MSLRGKTVWVVGGVGVVGRGIARGLLKAGATVIVNSRSAERLERIATDLQHPERLVTVLGSLRPGQAEETVATTLAGGANNQRQLHHVVAHGAVRYWTTKRAGCDETYSLETNQKGLLDQNTTVEEFTSQASQLAALHFSAARALIPRIVVRQDAAGAKHCPSYTFVTGDGGGHPSARRSAMGEINSHHVWGLAAALRQELVTAAAHQNSKNAQDTNRTVVCREIRIGLPVHLPDHNLDRTTSTTAAATTANGTDGRPISEDIGDLCAGMVAMTDGDRSRLIRIESQAEMEALLHQYRADGDQSVDPLPSFAEFVGSM
jgi:NAD(P)-dependent dehydrogenase (short-subunit alcohol dehydrogenase family)